MNGVTKKLSFVICFVLRFVMLRCANGAKIYLKNGEWSKVQKGYVLVQLGKG
jgi:hypothetical protein